MYSNVKKKEKKKESVENDERKPDCSSYNKLFESKYPVSCSQAIFSIILEIMLRIDTGL